MTDKIKVCIWPDGTWCFLSELDDYGWKSDDYEVYELSEDEFCEDGSPNDCYFQ